MGEADVADPARPRDDETSGASSVACLQDEPRTRRQRAHAATLEGDRRAAIRLAVAQAGPGDTVVVAGKGHETGQEVAGTVHPFDDRTELRAALEARVGARS